MNIYCRRQTNLIEQAEKRGFDEMFWLIYSIVLCVCLVDRCLSLCPCSFGQCCVFCPSIYGFWLPLWYLQNSLAASANNFLSLPTMYILCLLVNKSKKHLQNLTEKNKNMRRSNCFHEYSLFVRTVPKSSRKVIAKPTVVKKAESSSWSLYFIYIFNRRSCKTW